MVRDDRLDLVNNDDQLTTLPAYRMWSDSQLLVVPKGYSTSKPLQSEQIQANVNVYGDFEKGFFNPPCVQFKNTTNRLPFDSFCLAVNRPEFTPKWKSVKMNVNIFINIEDKHFILNNQNILFLRGLNEKVYRVSNNNLIVNFTLKTIFDGNGLVSYSINYLDYRYKNTKFYINDYDYTIETEVLNVTS